MRVSFIPYLLLSLGLTTSSAQLTPYVVHERRSYLPSGWSVNRKPDAASIIPLRFALAQSNIENLDALLHDVSHPNSPNYGQHWSADKVASTFSPSRQTISAVRNWLVDSGINPQQIKLSPSKGWLEIKVTVLEAEDLLHASYSVYEHETGVEHIGCEQYHLPEDLTSYVDFVMPTVQFDAKLSKRSKRSNIQETPKSVVRPVHGFWTSPSTTGVRVDVDQLGDCDTHITPSCLRSLYNFYYDPVVPNKNSYGIVEYTPQAYIQSDLDMFAGNFSTDLVGVSPNMVSIDGGALSSYNNFSYNGESNLDLEYSMNLVTKQQSITLYQVGDLIEGINSSFNTFLDALDGEYCVFDGGDDPSVDGVYPDEAPGGYKGHDCGTVVDPAYVISTSYGYNEADLTAAYATRQCNEYAKLGLRGITFLYSSGDYGVAGDSNYCLNPDGTQTTSGKIFNPSFPGTCPYVTSVGATQLSPGKSISDGEDACEQVIYSGGGFSNYFAIPDYQKEAVANYLINQPPPYPKDIWNSTGKSRAFPDIAANGANYVIAIEGNFTRIYGTSASSPVVGAMLTMVNDARLAAGKGPIGFINPTIYSSNFSLAFNDITNGTNPGCGTRGFNTSVGWDPVTGLGTPNFPNILEKWLAMP